MSVLDETFFLIPVLIVVRLKLGSILHRKKQRSVGKHHVTTDTVSVRVDPQLGLSCVSVSLSGVGCRRTIGSTEDRTSPQWGDYLCGLDTSSFYIRATPKFDDLKRHQTMVVVASLSFRYVVLTRPYEDGSSLDDFPSWTVGKRCDSGEDRS